MIVLDQLTLRRGSKVVLDQADLRIQAGEKVALIGRNGAGKSSLFALITNDLHEDSGSFAMPVAWRLAQVAQNLPDSSVSATDFVLAGDTNLIAAQAKLGEAESKNDGSCR